MGQLLSHLKLQRPRDSVLLGPSQHVARHLSNAGMIGRALDRKSGLADDIAPRAAREMRGRVSDATADERDIPEIATNRTGIAAQVYMRDGCEY